ncbi:hypothetical protein TREES_T100003224 [Tupaia chinensis]|uniref:Uncharacterized protein n=1 Tax=Tupaia chinensis TaxID=246437 RepID=L9K388_TUPCH|nr:hypothetical protein TREES_T100003224 [Tupaia chinensis]
MHDIGTSGAKRLRQQRRDIISWFNRPHVVSSIGNIYTLQPIGATAMDGSAVAHVLAASILELMPANPVLSLPL